MSAVKKRKKLKAPFPAIGGKSRAAEIVWPRLGEVENYIEPFCFSAAMLLLRPDEPRVETINDVNCYVANFWRSVSKAPEIVAAFADAPVNEVDLHARHRWLVNSRESREFRERMKHDPDYYDTRIAGWWCWGLCCWIGSGWCETPEWSGRISGLTGGGSGRGVNSSVAREPANWNQMPAIGNWNCQNLVNPSQQLPDLSGDSGAVGRGVHASGGPKQRPDLEGRGVSSLSRPTLRHDGVHQKLPDISGHSGGTGRGVNAKRITLSGRSHRDAAKGVTARPQLADAFSRGRGVNGNDTLGKCEERRLWLIDWFLRLQDRLRPVRVCCGHWKRVCDSPSVTTRLGLTGIFLDPPYPIRDKQGKKSRDSKLYATDSSAEALDRLRDEVLDYCRERGADPKMRIAVCGYDTDGYAELEGLGWRVVSWKANGGYGNRGGKGNANALRERIWFSPACIDPDAEDPQLRLFGTEDE